VQHVFSALVCNPLYNVTEAKKRGEEGMQAILALHNEHGTPRRPWGPPVEGKRLIGELDGIRAGTVQIIRSNGDKHTVKTAELTETDVSYLKNTLAKADAQLLFGSSGANDKPTTTLTPSG